MISDHSVSDLPATQSGTLMHSHPYSQTCTGASAQTHRCNTHPSQAHTKHPLGTPSDLHRDPFCPVKALTRSLPVVDCGCRLAFFASGRAEGECPCSLAVGIRGALLPSSGIRLRIPPARPCASLNMAADLLFSWRPRRDWGAS